MISALPLSLKLHPLHKEKEIGSTAPLSDIDAVTNLVICSDFT